MSRAFITLHDSAAAQGLLSTAPEFARQLRATTERFAALAQRAGDEVGVAESVDSRGSVGSNEESPESGGGAGVWLARGSTSPEGGWRDAGYRIASAPDAIALRPSVDAGLQFGT
ncbi:hypothetical protein IMZ48_01460, partial [Candidatus Bathyarchaeota archaeon]|nr:hypothetical protein [Candidatus Bathyarchaeota archaeon]